MIMTDDWYFQEGGKVHGPMSQAELQRRAALGEFKPDTLVSGKGGREWGRADRFPFLAPFFGPSVGVQPESHDPALALPLVASSEAGGQGKAIAKLRARLLRIPVVLKLATVVGACPDSIKQLAIGIAVLVGIFLGAVLFGRAFRANMLFFVLLWIAAPSFACLLCRRSVLACFTLAGLRRIQGILMAVVVALSFVMFYFAEDVRNHVGEGFVAGYAHWPSGRFSDDGREYEDWSAETRIGELGLEALELALVIGWFGLPVITWRASNAAYYKKEAEWRITADGWHIETYQSRLWPDPADERRASRGDT